MHLHTHTCTCTHTHAHTHAHTHTHTHTLMHHACKHTPMCTQAHGTYQYTHTHTFTHTRVHTCMQKNPQKLSAHAQAHAHTYRQLHTGKIIKGGVSPYRGAHCIGIWWASPSGYHQHTAAGSLVVPVPAGWVLSTVTLCLCRPEVTFNLRMMKALQMMEVPLLKSWIHTNVMEGFTKGTIAAVF